MPEPPDTIVLIRDRDLVGRSAERLADGSLVFEHGVHVQQTDEATSG